MFQSEKNTKHGLKLNPKSINNHSKNNSGKRDEKKRAIPEKTWAGGSRVGPKGYHFKRFPSEENREESQQKGANILDWLLLLLLLPRLLWLIASFC